MWMNRNGNGLGLGQISSDFESSGFGFGVWFSPQIFGFGYPKVSRFAVVFQFHPQTTIEAPKKFSPLMGPINVSKDEYVKPSQFAS